MKSTRLFLLLLAPAFASAATIPDSELALGGIALGDTEATVMQRLGPPGRRVDTGEGLRLEYPGLTLWTGLLEDAGTPGVDRRVLEVLSTSAEHCTPSGSCPGQPLADVRARLGAPLHARREDGPFLEYVAAKTTCWLQLAERDGRVLSIRAVCQP